MQTTNMPLMQISAVGAACLVIVSVLGLDVAELFWLSQQLLQCTRVSVLLQGNWHDLTEHDEVL